MKGAVLQQSGEIQSKQMKLRLHCLDMHIVTEKKQLILNSAWKLELQQLRRKNIKRNRTLHSGQTTQTISKTKYSNSA